MRSLLPLLLLLGLAAALRPAALRPAVRLRSRSQPPVLQAKDDEEEGNAFAAFAARVQQQNLKKGEGAPTRDASFPVRLGGSTRDGSLGDLRAAFNNLKSIRSPRDLEAEELGLLGVILSFVVGTAFFYFTYVADPTPTEEVKVSKAQAELSRALAECGDAACMERVRAEKEPAVILERQLDDCFAKAFSGTERNICKRKFGGAATPFGF